MYETVTVKLSLRYSEYNGWLFTNGRYVTQQVAVLFTSWV